MDPISEELQGLHGESEGPSPRDRLLGGDGPKGVHNDLREYEILLQFSVRKRKLTLCEVGAHYLINPIEEREDPQLEMISLKTGGVYGMVEAELRIIMTEILARLKG
ncbi:MAG: hypothetical protein L7H21_07100 [Sulfolobales archaeon]|nr:hypothetical protein [Sulfolobales archaeon]MCG2894553.1 hypothetical protein [Sulfolobales archaeon]MCG2911375.1 hypothetical protein [Sulfolobales archaeon]